MRSQRWTGLMTPAVLVVAFLLLAAAKLDDRPSIGVVDLNAVFDGCDKKELLEKNIAEAMAPVNEGLKALEKKINTAKEDLALLQKGTTRYDELEKQLFGYLQEARFEQSKATERLAQLTLKYRNELVGEITAAIAAYGKDHGYSVILQREFTLPKESNTWQAVLYQDDAVDLTQKILTILNES